MSAPSESQAAPGSYDLLAYHRDGGIQLFPNPWVAGTRAAAYFGPVSCALFLVEVSAVERPEAWYRVECELLDALRSKIEALGANAGVGLEVTADLWAEDGEGRKGLRLHAVCTAARLEPLYA